MKKCHCGSEVEFKNCCEPLLKGEKVAATAEALMRSRYSAFVEGNIDYIIASSHAETRDELDIDNIKEWSGQSEWLGLEIVATEHGLEADEEGLVEFKANYQVGGEKICHHETSEFVKEDGQWFYADGHVFPQVQQVVRAATKVGRNDPCPCGSGKKFKKCCG